MKKYSITITEVIPADGEKYPRNNEIYTQDVEIDEQDPLSQDYSKSEEFVKRVIKAVNNF